MDTKNIGQGKGNEEVVNAYDAEHGSYKELSDQSELESRLPLAENPLHPDPNPFKLGGIASGGR